MVTNILKAHSNKCVKVDAKKARGLHKTLSKLKRMSLFFSPLSTAELRNEVTQKLQDVIFSSTEHGCQSERRVYRSE